MSYFIVDENTLTDNQELINMDGNNIPINKRNHQGELNPHYNHPHSDKAKAAISSSQKARYDYYKKAAASIVTEDRVREIIKETVQDYLSQNAVQTNNNRPNNIPL
jgi:hypothetical protein